MDLTPFYVAVGTYGVYLVFLLSTGGLKGVNPNLSACKAHLGFALGYVAAGGWLGFVPADGLVGLFAYFALHYAFFMPVLGLATRSVSVNILTTLYERKGLASLGDCYAGYAGGKGYGSIKRDRLAHMLRNGMLVEQDGKLRIAPFGRFMLLKTKWVLRAWGLRPLGGSGQA